MVRIFEGHFGPTVWQKVDHLADFFLGGGLLTA